MESEKNEQAKMEAAELERKRDRERREIVCKPLLPLFREKRKADSEALAIKHAVSMALRAATGTEADAAAVAVLIDRQRVLTALSDAKLAALRRAAPEVGFGTGIRIQMTVDDVINTLRRMVHDAGEDEQES